MRSYLEKLLLLKGEQFLVWDQHKTTHGICRFKGGGCSVCLEDWPWFDLFVNCFQWLLEMVHLMLGLGFWCSASDGAHGFHIFCYLVV